MRKTKIVCTIGPASREQEIIASLIDAGMDVARLNMSHGAPEEHAAVIEIIRRLAAAKNRSIAILLDLSGPKIRLGELSKPVDLVPGDAVRLTARPLIGEGNLLPVNHPDLAEELQPGHQLSMADGQVMLEITAVEGDDLIARVLSGGTLTSRKGVNLPTGGRRLPSLTEKDAADLDFGIRHEVDWVALSFVRCAADAARPREIMLRAGRPIPLLAKIEKRQAVEHIDEILEAFDGLMVARGDLGVELLLEDIPGTQKDLISKANMAAKPVITATQMLLSMVDSPRPTRAEVTDVANAILDGTDAVMLSEETAIGRHPVRTVRTMASIAERAEARMQADAWSRESSVALDVPTAIARASRRVAQSIGAPLILTPTTSGSTARLVAATRPPMPILATSADPATVRRMALYRGVHPLRVEDIKTTDALFEMARRAARASGLAATGQSIVITAGVPLNVQGTTSLLQVLKL